MLDTEGLSITSKQRAIYPSGRRKGKKATFSARDLGCFWPAWSRVLSIFHGQSVHCLLFPGLRQQPIYSGNSPFGEHQKTGPWLTPPVLKGWLCCSREPSSARGKLFNHAWMRVEQRVHLCVSVRARALASASACVCASQPTCLCLGYPSVSVSLCCLYSCALFMFMLVPPLAVCRGRSCGKPYQLYDARVLRALIDSIYLGAPAL